MQGGREVLDDILPIVIAWIIATGVFLLSVIYPMRIYIKHKLQVNHPISKANKFLRKIHKPLGVVIIPLTFLHCRFSSQKLGLNIGTALLFILVLLLLSYFFRKLLKSKWMGLHRSLTLALWVLLIVHIIFDTERINDYMTLNVSLTNVFWYFLAYGAVTMIAMQFIPKEKRKKILTYTPQGSKGERIATIISLTSKYAAMALSFFLPTYGNVYTFWFGNVLFATGLTLATVAMWQFSTVLVDRPITTGLYRITRNPMHVMGFIMCIGIALVANNLLMWILAIVNIIASYPMFVMQERFCLEKYGKEYADYMNKTPRVLFIKSGTKDEGA